MAFSNWHSCEHDKIVSSLKIKFQKPLGYHNFSILLLFHIILLISKLKKIQLQRLNSEKQYAVTAKCKETVSSMFIGGKLAFSIALDQCDCTCSTFCDPHQKHIIIGDLRIVRNHKLRKLLTNGPNSGEPRLMSFSFKTFFSEINSAIDSCIENMATKNKKYN